AQRQDSARDQVVGDGLPPEGSHEERGGLPFAVRRHSRAGSRLPPARGGLDRPVSKCCRTSMKAAFVHAGAHKTASSFIQSNLNLHKGRLREEHDMALVTRADLIPSAF